MRIVFDMDNTLADEFGAEIRPGIMGLLQALTRDGHYLILWTNSAGDRAKAILREHGFTPLFKEFLYREDYDPENKGLPKDIARVQGDFIIDDDPWEVEYNRKRGKKGFVITAFRKGGRTDPEELQRLYAAINKKGFLGGLFG